MNRLVLCHGCFDILHVGHFEHLRAARALGGWLVVSVTAAEWVRRAKGKGHPAHTDEERVGMLRDLRFVDDVWLCDEQGGSSAIRRFRPAIYAKGVDYAGRGITQVERDACAEVGAQVVYTTTRKRSVSEMVEAFD